MKKILLFTIISISSVFGGLIHPPDGSELSYIHVMFRWGTENNAISYEFELSNSEDFSSVLINDSVTDTIYLIKEFIDWQSTYFWRVKAVGNNWISTNSFSTGSTISNVSTTLHDENNYSEGYTIFGTIDGYYSAIIDKDGDEIWNSGNDSIIYYNFLDDGQFFGARYSPNNTYQYIGSKFSLTGGIKWREPNDEFVHHEFMQLPWGDYMGIAHETQLGPIHATGNIKILYQIQCGCDVDENEWPWWGDRLVIWDKNSKEIKWTWSSFDYFSMDDYDVGLWNTPPPAPPDNHFDWTHVNAFAFETGDNCIPQDSCIYISTRNLSRISKIDYPSGEIIWNMGHNFEYGSHDVTFGHDLGFSRQHSISLTNEGNFLILDNGNYSVEYWGANSATTRALEIDVNASTQNADIVWEYILPSELYSPDAGNVQQLSNGNYLITISKSPGTSLEVTPDNEIVWEANYSTYAMWRASRIPKSILSDMQMENTLSLNNTIIPNECNIEKIYPNPFNPIINIDYEISEFSFVSAKILNLRGQLIDILYSGYKKPGNYSILWDGSLQPSGMYLFVLDNQTSILIQKIMLVK